ncbi:MAG: hypoxanthine-guanine phosphoribosyltransferase [Gammaproteobacteria bacterium]|nr:hypoxanthine-guanine phosphoribosyltransferase [Gammaproteobacteria bacterium]
MIVPEYIREVSARATRIFSEQDIEQALDSMAYQISSRWSESNPIFLCVLIGGIIPLGNLLPRLDFPLEVNYIHVTRYTGKSFGDEIIWKTTPSVSLKDRTVIVVDDILDGGLTLAAIIDYCKEQGAKDVFTTVLVDKKKARAKDGVQEADVHGLIVDDQFVFGYGLDYKEYLRNAPGIYVAAPEDE